MGIVRGAFRVRVCKHPVIDRWRREVVRTVVEEANPVLTTRHVNQRTVGENQVARNVIAGVVNEGIGVSV